MEIKYVITTVKELYQEPLEYLLDSMIIHGINPKNIFLSSQDTNSLYTNISKVYFKRYNISLYSANIPKQLYEYSFFIACQEFLNAGIFKINDYFFLIHDTSIIKNNHKSKILNIVSNNTCHDIIYGNCTGQHNIGLFNYKAINLGYNIYKKHKYLNKKLAIDIEHNNANANFSIKRHNDKINIFYPNIPWSEKRNVKVYKQNIMRVVSALDYFDIEKYYVHVDQNNPHPHNIF